MRQKDNYDQAVEYAKAAMDFLAKQRIPPTPDAIAVCYGYVSERDPAVTLCDRQGPEGRRQADRRALPENPRQLRPAPIRSTRPCVAPPTSSRIR